MKKQSRNIEQILGLDKVDYAELAHLVHQKNYTAQALAFISNHSRTLNYWGEGEHDLLPHPPPKEGTRRRYSFLDLVWLAIVKELRDFGLEKEAIHHVKHQLLHTNNKKDLLALLDKDPKKFEADLVRQSGINTIQAREVMASIRSKKNDLESMEDSVLLNRIYSVLSVGMPLHFLFTKEGQGAEFIESNLQTELQNNVTLREVYRGPHVSIFLNRIVSSFLVKEYISEELRNAVFTEGELAMIQELQHRDAKSIVINFGPDSRVESIENSETIKVQPEARLTEIIPKKGYSVLNLQTLDGKILHAKRTRKNKL